MDKEKIDTLRQYMNVIEQQTGRIVRPYREDGFVNVLNKYGTYKDTTEHYFFANEPEVPDSELEAFYEGNGLFAKVIDAPAEEAIKHGFTININDEKLEKFYKKAFDELDFDDKAATGIKWARLFGGAIGVMFINDGRGLEEPLDWRNIRNIDEIRIYDRSMVIPYMNYYGDYTNYHRVGASYERPEFYDVFAEDGNFRVHESRCLVFRNGILPRNAQNSIYRQWGMPEYIRIHRAVRDTEVAHGMPVKLLDRSIQAVYSMRGLSTELAAEGGEERILKRLQTIDMARGLLNSITIDADGEGYDFRQFSYTGVAEVIDATCNYVSALTNIPQTILFGRSPAGMNATGNGDLENWYNYVERIQKRMLKRNIGYLLDIVFQAGYNRGFIDEVPEVEVEFNPLWSYTDQEKMQLDQQKAQIEQTRAATAGTYVEMQVLDPSEVRKSLAKSDEFDIETMLDEYTEEELEENEPKPQDMMGGLGGTMGGMPGQNAPKNAKNDPEFCQNEEDDEIAEDETEDEINGVLTHQGVMNRLTDAFQKYAPIAGIKKALADVQYRYLRRKVDRLVKRGIIHNDNSAWQERLHPRAKNGRFAEVEGKGGAGNGGKTGRKKASDRNAEREEKRSSYSEVDKAKDREEKKKQAEEEKRKAEQRRKLAEDLKRRMAESPEAKLYGADKWAVAQKEAADARREGRPIKASAKGCNKFVRGFGKTNLDDHWYGNPEKDISSHMSEFPGMTKEQYAARGLELIQTPVGGDILGHVNNQNQVVRFNKATGEFVKGDPNRGIATLMKAHYESKKRVNGRLVYNLDSAMRYYQNQLEEDLKDGGREED